MLRKAGENMRKGTSSDEKARGTTGDIKESGFLIFGTSPVATLVVGQDGTIEYVNQAFQELTEFSAEELATLRAPYPWQPREEPNESLKDLRDLP